MGYVSKVLTIAQYTLISGYRSRTLLLSLISVTLCWFVADFAGTLTLTESHETRLAIYAFLARFMAVLIASLLVINSVQHELTDRQLNLFVSLDLPRAVYIIGKLTGFFGAVLVIALLVSIPLILSSETAISLAWSVSLFLELSIVVAFSMFIITAVQNNTLSLLIVLALYILSRAIADLLLLSQSPILETGGSINLFAGRVLQAIYVVLPDLWNFARTEWLLYGEIAAAVVYENIIQTVIAVMLLTVATIFDFYRKNL